MEKGKRETAKVKRTVNYQCFVFDVLETMILNT